MHAAVLFFWLLDETAPAPWTEPWQAQRDEIFAHVRAGRWWGTIASEPGSGGDLLATKARARPDGDSRYRLTGDKHLASGSAITSFMVTIAVADGEDLPDLVWPDLPELQWDRSTQRRRSRSRDRCCRSPRRRASGSSSPL